MREPSLLHVPRWLPNAISTLRVLALPLWLIWAFEARSTALLGDVPDNLPGIGILVFLGISDIVDGWLARRFHLATNFGATLDAVADKLAQIVTVTFLALAGAPAFTPLPVWLMGTLIIRDVVLAIGFASIRIRQGRVQAFHAWHGKVSSVILFGLTLAALARAPQTLVDVISVIIVVIVISSTAAYFQNGWRQFSRTN